MLVLRYSSLSLYLSPFFNCVYLVLWWMDNEVTMNIYVYVFLSSRSLSLFVSLSISLSLSLSLCFSLSLSLSLSLFVSFSLSIYLSIHNSFHTSKKTPIKSKVHGMSPHHHALVPPPTAAASQPPSEFFGSSAEHSGQLPFHRQHWGVAFGRKRENEREKCLTDTASRKNSKLWSSCESKKNWCYPSFSQENSVFVVFLIERSRLITSSFFFSLFFFISLSFSISVDGEITQHDGRAQR